MCGSFCTFSDCFAALERLLSLGCTVVPVMSFNAYETAEHRERLAAMCGRDVIHTIAAAEPIGPMDMTDVMLVANCTGNTLAKLAASITDTTVIVQRNPVLYLLAGSKPIKLRF